MCHSQTTFLSCYNWDRNSTAANITSGKSSTSTDAVFVQDTRALIQKTLTAPAENELVKWSAFKEQWMNLALLMMKRIRNRMRKKARKLVKKFKQTKSSLESKKDATSHAEFREAHDNLNEFQLNQHILRQANMKVKWQKEGERGTRFHHNLFKSRIHKTTIEALTDPSDNIAVSDQPLIRKIIKGYYEKLYKSTGVNNSTLADLLQSLQQSGTRVPDKLNAKSEEPFTLEELKKALLQLGSKKSPGSDGIPIEYYKYFWNDDLGTLYLRMIEAAIAQQSLPANTSESIITLLFKKGDRSAPANYRPISLMNNDYKILAKALANRLAPVLQIIVPTIQTGFIPDRNIIDNVMSILDIILHYDDGMDENTILLLLDMEKAFDRVNWTAIMETLKAIGFKDNFMNAVKTILSDNSSANVIVNGTYTDSFKVTRSVRQGCPLSPLLFVVVSLLFITSIKDAGIHALDTDSHRLVLDSSQLMLKMFADDAAVISHVNDLQKAFDAVGRYGEATEAKANQKKSEVIPINPHLLEPNIMTALGAEWKTERTRYRSVTRSRQSTNQPSEVASTAPRGSSSRTTNPSWRNSSKPRCSSRNTTCPFSAEHTPRTQCLSRS